MNTAAKLKAAIRNHMCILNDDDADACAWLYDILDKVTEPTSRIAITVRGGVAEIADAENWPEGLEVYLADYDCDSDDEGVCHVEGPCLISKQTSDDEILTGHYASKLAEAWNYD